MLRVRPDAQKDPALLPSRLRIALLVLSLQESQVSQLRCCPGVPSIRSALQAPQHTSDLYTEPGPTYHYCEFTVHGNSSTGKMDKLTFERGVPHWEDKFGLWATARETQLRVRALSTSVESLSWSTIRVIAENGIRDGLCSAVETSFHSAQDRDRSNGVKTRNRTPSSPALLPSPSNPPLPFGMQLSSSQPDHRPSGSGRIPSYPDFL
jgi:hypothetical protein